MPSWAVRAGLVSEQTRRFHRIRWYGRTGEYGEAGWVPRSRRMKARDWGWDVRCSCGWQSHTGGGIEAWIKREIEDHLIDAEFHHTNQWNGKGFYKVPWRPVRWVGRGEGTNGFTTEGAA